MGWELKGKPVSVKATAKLSEEYANMEAAHVDRPLSERRIEVYRILRDRGQFRPLTWAKAWCKETGQYYRVNGKHTSTLFSDGVKLDNIYITLEEYICDTLQDVAHLYGTFDSGVASRTASDINASFASTIVELKDFGGKFINLAVSGLTFVPYHGSGGTKSRDMRTAADRAEELFDNVDEVVWLESVMGRVMNQDNRHMFRMPVVAAMFATWRKHQKDATAFWKAVRDATGITPDLPDRKLSKFLTTTSSNQGNRSAIPLRYRITPREYYVKSIIAWNAWRNSEPTSLAYHIKANLPAVV